MAEIDPRAQISYDFIKKVVDPQDELNVEDPADYLGIEQSDLDDDRFLENFVNAVDAFYREVAHQL